LSGILFPSILQVKQGTFLVNYLLTHKNAKPILVVHICQYLSSGMIVYGFFYSDTCEPWNWIDLVSVLLNFLKYLETYLCMIPVHMCSTCY
jgi:hypothetical protein